MPEIFKAKMRPVARVGAPTPDFIRLQPEGGAPRPPGVGDRTIDATTEALIRESSARISALDQGRASRLVETSRALGLPPVAERRGRSLGAAGDTVSIAIERTDAKMWLFGAEVVRTVDGAGSFFTLYTADAAAIFWLKCRPEGTGVYLAEIHTDGSGGPTAVSVQSADGSNQSMMATPGTQCLRAVFELAPTSGFTLMIRPQGGPLRVFRVDVTRLS